MENQKPPFFDSKEIQSLKQTLEQEKEGSLQALEFQIMELSTKLLTPNISKENEEKLNELLTTLKINYNDLVAEDFSEKNTEKLFDIYKN